MPHTVLAITVGELRARIEAIERELSMIRHWAMRCAILLALWLTAVVANLNAEQAAKLLVGVLK